MLYTRNQKFQQYIYIYSYLYHLRRGKRGFPASHVASSFSNLQYLLGKCGFEWIWVGFNRRMPDQLFLNFFLGDQHLVADTLQARLGFVATPIQSPCYPGQSLELLIDLGQKVLVRNHFTWDLAPNWAKVVLASTASWVDTNPFSIAANSFSSFSDNLHPLYQNCIPSYQLYIM